MTITERQRRLAGLILVLNDEKKSPFATHCLSGAAVRKAMLKVTSKQE